MQTSQTIDPAARPPESSTLASDPGFDIAFTYSGNALYKPVFEAAIARWEQIITGDLPDFSSPTYGAIDDLLIAISVVPIDGTNGILGSAAPNEFRGVAKASLPTHGGMSFDSADIARLYDDGDLLGVVIHEIGHILGLGTLWDGIGLRSGHTYTGAYALAEYRALTGRPGDTSIPLEDSGGAGSVDSHWRESIFDAEIMTSLAEQGPVPISRMTIAALKDLGYAVNFAAADSYILPAEINITGNGLTIIDGDSSPSNIDSTIFGTLFQGGLSVEHTFTVVNSGTGLLKITGLTVPTGFTLIEGLSSVIAGGASDTFTIAFDSVGAGVKTGQVIISNSDINEGPYSFTVTGTVNPNEVAGDSGANALTGTGYDDYIEGFGGNDTLSGGSAGNDTLVGGDGNDIYLNPGSTTIIEAAGQGIDTIVTGTSLILAAIPNVERLFFTGTSSAFGIGNTLDNHMNGNAGNNILDGAAGSDLLNGGAGNDTLVGGTGADTLNGGQGDDTYLNPGSDLIGEGAGQGTDTVHSATSFSLASIANVERLFLSGTAAIDGNGNALGNFMQGNGAANVLNGFDGDDTIQGSDGADRLNGGTGADSMTGGSGADRVAPGTDSVADIVRVAAPVDSTGATRDTIIGFDANGEDKFDLPSIPAAFNGSITTGTLNEASFNADLQSIVNATKLTAFNAVVFNPSAGTADYANTVYLIVDANGVAGYQANADFVFQVELHAGTFDTGDFI